MSSMTMPRSMAIPRVQQRPTNLIASKTEFDWADIDAQLDELPDELPDPVGYTVMILQLRPKLITDGGIIMPDEFRDKQQSATDVGIVLAVGGEAYTDKVKFPAGEPWCRPYDIVGWDRYAGSARSYGGVNLLFMNDDQIRCRWQRPSPPADASDDADASRASGSVSN